MQKKNRNELKLMFALVSVALVAISLLYAILSIKINPRTIINAESTGFSKFTSEQDFMERISESRNYGYSSAGLGGARMTTLESSVMKSADSSEGTGASAPEIAPSPERFSETNVQVLGIDEPDIVKTDGKTIYYSPETLYYRTFAGAEFADAKVMPPYYYYSPKTFVIDSNPSESPEVRNRINATGELLLTSENLIILGNEKITAYDMQENKDWELPFNNSYLVSARLYNGKMYLVLKKSAYYSTCPIMPLGSAAIRCTDIYYPNGNVPIDTVYFVFEVESSSGEITKELSFAAPDSQTNVYVSEKSIFVAVSYSKSEYEILRNFILEDSDLFPSEVVSRVKSLDSYDISESAKITEIQVILSSHMSTLDGDEQLTLANRMNDFRKKHAKELESTRIAKIDISSLSLSATGEVPGTLLNQFSIDEYSGYLRTAVTFGDWDSSENAIVILDSGLNKVGETENFGTSERIYSVRFIKELAYVVTFKQTDPFFIMDLSNPEAPVIKGELKIPGYSAYLHPVSDSIMIGIGKEGNQVKASLFDISNPEKPRELSKYILSEYWSDILSTHHAFLLDAKHKVFFLPGSEGGHIISYENEELSHVKSIKESGVKRAIYINDLLYIFTSSKIVTVDESSWERMSELNLVEQQ
ncbi:MAG: beta-propeller domain-containing protein [Candidatus Woesearchaeota archaeon]|nr:beta-propeller domain-containing protein [Candidatus Woesearchaeota archaeon]